MKIKNKLLQIQSLSKSINNLLKKGSFPELIELLNSNKQKSSICFNSEGITKYSESLEKLFTNCLHLTRLTLKIKDDFKSHFSLLREFLKTNKHIEELNLSSNNIDEDGVKLICEILKQNNHIKELNLSNNLIGPEGTEELIEILKTNPSLKTLDISNNQIGNDTIIKLCDLLKINTNLTDLAIKDNGVNSKGSKKLSEMLRINQGLNKLILADQEIGYDAYKSLIDNGLAHNYYLTSFSLESFGRNNPTSLKAYELTKRNKGLVEKFAKKLKSLAPLEAETEPSSSIKLCLKSLNYFKHCDKEMLLKFFAGNEKLLNELVDHYLAPEFYKKNFFLLAGICKSKPEQYHKEKEETGIYNLPKVLLGEIASYIPVEDYTLELSEHSDGKGDSSGL